MSKCTGGRWFQWPSTAGENSRQAKLTDELVLAIRRDYDCGLTMTQLGRKYNISPSHAQRIGARRVWRHLP